MGLPLYHIDAFAEQPFTNGPLESFRRKPACPLDRVEDARKRIIHERRDPAGLVDGREDILLDVKFAVPVDGELVRGFQDRSGCAAPSCARHMA